jgi:haloalkane dehalogenase
MIHGFPTWSFMYRNLIRGLSKDFRCLAPDLFGFGLSEKPVNWSYSFLDQVRVLSVFLDQTADRRVTLVGHDMGLALALAVAIEKPERVARIVMMNGSCWDTSSDPKVRTMQRMISGLCGKVFFEKMNSWPRVVRRLFGPKHTPSREFLAGLFGPLATPEARTTACKSVSRFFESGAILNDVWSQRSKLEEVPVLILWGMADRVYGESYLSRIWHEFPLADVQELVVCGRFPTEERPAETLKAVREFLALSRHKPYLA